MSSTFRFLLVPAGVPVLVSLLLSSLVPVRCLSPFFSLLSFLRKGVLFHHDLLVPGSGARLSSSLFFGSGACLHYSFFFLFLGKGFCSIMICWFLLVPAGVPVLCSSLFFSLLWLQCLSPFFSLLSFLRKGVLFHHDLLVPPGSGWGSGSFFSIFFLFSGKGFHEF